MLLLLDIKALHTARSLFLTLRGLAQRTGCSDECLMQGA